jgi:diguanylate cyclase (GGDEF)-like protein/putative nucleotidyltransferase with HDIG domain
MEGAPPQSPPLDEQGPAIGQVSCSMASTLIRYARTKAGDEAVQEILKRADVEYSATFLDDVGNWIWHTEAIALFVAAAEVLGDEEIGVRVGEQTVRQHAGTPVATLLRGLGSPEAVYAQMTVGVSKFSTVTELIPEVEPGRAVIRAKSRNGSIRHRHMCNWTRGLLSTPPELFGLPPATVEESRCAANGDDCCLYTITWDADEAAKAADPQQLITALEAQLVAMTDRLESMYATARDLIALDDLDAALARITERAATAVRAPSYLLAVRTHVGDPLRVHHHGYVDQDVDAAARHLLDGTTDSGTGARLIVDVASATRHYGRLMASSPAGAFFPHERDLLDVYARYAAAVLDMATAYDEAQRREEQSVALLELSRAMAVASTSDEVAQRLADAVPAVVDCDRVGAFLWDEDEEALVCRAVTGQSGNHELLRDLRIHRSDTPVLEDWLADPRPSPIFFEADTEQTFVAGIMHHTGAQALIVVPIVAHDRLYGSLHVSVTRDPERLQPTAALLDVLAGVVAQAATALDNARLIETMAHQARFDNLTGLLGHRAFHEALEIQLERSNGPFTLASIDLDDFKLINDLHGHPIGDEALRRVAETLRRGVGEHDSVFRVGGEEFAVLLPRLTASEARPVAESLRAAVARTPFALPLRVSIGLASWPADAAERDTLLERADAALYAAKRAGKDRVAEAADRTEGAAGISRGGPTSLLDVLRAKDGATMAHSARVATLAIDVARVLDIDPERLADLRIAGQLHDVGKLAVPDEVLNKPAALDEAEMRLVRTHPVVGAELVRAWGFSAAARFVLEHHERIDGLGYPAGLAGEDISIEGRILHVVDAFSAMTSDRPYRRALTVENAFAELKRLSGTQFDPAVVAALEHTCGGLEPLAWTVETIAQPAREHR